MSVKVKFAVWGFSGAYNFSSIWSIATAYKGGIVELLVDSDKPSSWRCAVCIL